MPEMLMPSSALFARGLDRSVAMVTDGRYSGVTHGPCVGYVVPEAADRGPISRVRNGDLIRIDIPGRRLDLLVSEEELLKRPAVELKPRTLGGFLKLYVGHVSASDSGCVMETAARD